MGESDSVPLGSFSILGGHRRRVGAVTFCRRRLSSLSTFFTFSYFSLGRFFRFFHNCWSS